MKVLLFGATGMIGQGALRECELDPRVTAITTVGRRPPGPPHPKRTDVVLADLFLIGSVADRLTDFDACFYCVGVTSAGASEADYTRLTYELTMTVAEALAPRNPGMAFVYVTGSGTDSAGRMMWSRVKGRTEDALLAMPFRAAFMVRPRLVQPLHGITSRTGWYRLAYAVTAPLHGALLRWFPASVTTTERLGRAMIEAAAHGHERAVIETPEINRLGATAT